MFKLTDCVNTKLKDQRLRYHISLTATLTYRPDTDLCWHREAISIREEGGGSVACTLRNVPATFANPAQENAVLAVCHSPVSTPVIHTARHVASNQLQTKPSLWRCSQGCALLSTSPLSQSRRRYSQITPPPSLSLLFPCSNTPSFLPSITSRAPHCLNDLNTHTSPG